MGGGYLQGRRLAGDDHGECGESRVGRDPRVKSFTVSSWL